MIDKEILNSLNKKEEAVFNYVERNREKAAYMNVRELAEECDVSTATILRFIKKLGLASYKEFKFWCLEQEKDETFNYYTKEIIECLRKTSNPIFEEKLEEAAALIKEKEFVIFYGIGNSGGTAQLGARYFSNFGIFSINLNDPFYNLEILPQNMVVIICSASGETSEVILEAKGFIRRQIPVICITSNEESSLARISDYTLAYYLRQQRKDKTFDMSSQIPAIHVIERLAHKIKK